MGKIKSFLIFGFLLISILKNNAQVIQEWEARYVGPVNVDIPYSMAFDRYGNVYVTGQSSGIGSNYDYTTVKYNSNGKQQWVQRYNGTGNSTDNAYSIAVDNSNNVYVTGRSWGANTKFDYATIKYDSLGVLQWVQRYDGSVNENDEAKVIAVDNLGNVYISGYSWGIYSDYCTIKYNSEGVQEWVRRYNSPPNGSDQPRSIAIDDSGNIYVTGGSYLYGPGYDYLTIKYDPSGIEQWISRYNGPANADDYASSVKVDLFGNVYVTGYSYGNGTGIDFATVKYDSNGIEQWVQRYNGPLGNRSDYARSLAIDNSGNVYVTGESNGIFDDYVTIKYSTSGNQEWVQRYNSPANSTDQPCCIAVDEFENVYVTGTTSLGSGTNTNYTTIKYSSEGTLLWLEVYKGNGNTSGSFDYAHGLVIDKVGNVYVTGESDGISTSRDYATIKYSQLVGIQQLSNSVSYNFSLSQNYPNPFNPVTNIKFSLPTTLYTILKIFDITGREVATLVNEVLQPGEYNYEFRITDYELSSGVYFYQLRVGEFVQTRKMVLTK